MTVLQRNDAMGVDLGKLGRIIAAAAIVAAFAAGAAYGVNVTATPTQTQAQVGQADAVVERLLNQFYAEANALNKADIGVTSGSTAPFMAGTSTPTHTGRTSVAVLTENGDRADLIFKQKAAELADPADRIHKQQAADLAD